jgi:8-oxo-dGTP pyrophosphatase MutT (NUDIX family)
MTYTPEEQIAFRSQLPSKYWSAGVLIFNTQDEVLLVKDVNGKWNTPGGIGEAGETMHQTALREMEEEIGIVVPIKQMLILDDKHQMINDFNDESWQTIWLCETITAEQIANIKLQAGEIEEYGFFTWKEGLNKLEPRTRKRLENITPGNWEFMYLVNEEKAVVSH